MKAKINLNYKATAYIDGKPSIVFANREAKKRFDDPPKYFCCGTDKSGKPCLAPMHLKTSRTGKHFFSAGTKVKHKEGCKYSKSTSARTIQPTTMDISLININDYFDKFSGPDTKESISSSPSTSGKGTTPNSDSENNEEYIEILGKGKLPNTLESLYDVLSEDVYGSTPSADDKIPKDIIVNNETFFDFYNHPEKLDNQMAICVCFFKKFENGVYKNAPVVNGYPAFTLVYPRNKSEKEAIHYCISFANVHLYHHFKKEYLDKSYFAPMLIFGKWERIKTADGDMVFHTTITSIKMLGRIKGVYKEEAEKNFLN